MSVRLDSLPQNVQSACTALRDELASLLGDELRALWLYGAVTFPDRPAHLGDVDTHGILLTRPAPDLARAIDDVHERIAHETNVEWDSWYVLESDARGAAPPAHALRVDLEDDAWALHRAHWLAGQYVRLHGAAPGDLVAEPAWAELTEALADELEFIDEIMDEAKRDAGHAAFAILNACRISYSLQTRDVVVSKLAASMWAVDHLPSAWTEAISAARRFYGGALRENDAAVMHASLLEIVDAARERVGHASAGTADA